MALRGVFSEGPAVITKPTLLTGKSLKKKKKKKKVIALFDLDFKEQSTSSWATKTNPAAFHPVHHNMVGFIL